jgi:hypothetical protein
MIGAMFRALSCIVVPDLAHAVQNESPGSMYSQRLKMKKVQLPVGPPVS